jgi:hypothetical protein
MTQAAEILEETGKCIHEAGDAEAAGRDIAATAEDSAECERDDESNH